MAGDFRSSGFESWRASAGVTRYLNDSVAGSSFANCSYQGATCDRVKLWSQAASRRPAVIDPVIEDAILESLELFCLGADRFWLCRKALLRYVRRRDAKAGFVALRPPCKHRFR